VFKITRRIHGPGRYAGADLNVFKKTP